VLPPRSLATCRVGGSVAGDAGFIFLVGEEVGYRHFGFKHQVEEADHHFVPALLAPDHFLGGIGVFRIGGGIIKVRGAFDPGSLG